MASELTAEQARATCDPERFKFSTTAELSAMDGIIGQPRAVAALRFGLGMPIQGFHVYLAGLPGTGRTTAVRAFLEEAAKGGPTPDDWCYVHNFQDPSRPRYLALPAGRGRQLAQDMRRLVESAQREIPRAFEREEYTARRDQVITAFQRQREQRLERMAQRAREEGFLLQATPMGLVLIPILSGQPVSEQDFASLTPEIRGIIQRKREALEEQVKATLKEIRQLERETQQQLEQMDREVALFAVGGLVEDLLETYVDLPAVHTYLKEVQEDMAANVDQFRPMPEAAQHPETMLLWQREQALRKYQVKLLVDNTGATGAPVVTEFNPTLPNLVGRIEKEARFGVLVTDFTLISSGALHRANGGYLVLQVEDVLRQPLAWDALKRSLRNREVQIEDVVESMGLAARTLRPEPIPLKVKVVLVGPPILYHLLYELDPDFRELFKVRADFDTQMDRTPETEEQYAAFICSVCRKEDILPFDRTGVAAMIEHGSRLAEDQRKLSTRFADVADVMREANYWALQDGSRLISGQHVRKALETKVYRSNLIQERIRELIARGVLLIDVQGEAVGQVNGLAVTTLADYSFGRPTRITATLGLGREGVVDIEREVKLGGPIHSKGVLIISGLLADRYAQDKPLSLSVRLTFEQSYEGIEGDSASSAEIYAILSRLADLPIKQGLAVTGSVNQRGEIQAIGGVNEKVEGFFEVCKALGLTGQQGVLIPASNVEHLMLKEEVVEAIRNGAFHIYPVRTVDEGIELLTGVPAGARLPSGQYEPGSVNDRVDSRLRAMAAALSAFQAGPGPRPGDHNDG